MYKISSSWNRCWYTAHTFRTFIKIVFRQKDKLLQHHISSYRNNKNEKSEISMIIMKWFWMNHKCKANVAILISLYSPPYAHTIRGARRRNNQTRMRTCDIKVSGCIVVNLIVIGCQNVFQLSWGGKTMANEKKKKSVMRPKQIQCPIEPNACVTERSIMHPLGFENWTTIWNVDWIPTSPCTFITHYIWIVSR